MKNTVLRALFALFVIGCGTGSAVNGDQDGGENIVVNTDGGTGNHTEDVTISTIVSCTVINSTGKFDYQHYLFSDGSLMVECEYSGVSFTISSTRLYKATQTGASTGACTFVGDLDGTASGGWWNYTYDGTSAKATYNDVGSTYNGTNYTLTCSHY